MKKLFSFILFVVFIYGLSAAPTVNAQAVFGPNGSTYTPNCQPTVPGMYYTMDAAQCRCPNGTIVWGNGQGYTDQCTWNTNVVCWDGSTAANQNSCPSYKYCPNESTKRSLWYQCPNVHIQNCQPTIPGMSYTMDAAQCKCPNGNIVWGNGGGYTSQCNWSTNVVCWDGSTAANQNSCPSYKYCPNDSIKRSLWYQCPSEVKTCSNGTVIPTYQNCPIPLPTCSYYQYWNGYRCVDNYSPYYPSYDYQDNNWFNWSSYNNFWDWNYNYYW